MIKVLDECMCAVCQAERQLAELVRQLESANG